MTHPLAILALIALVLNDHLLKAEFSNAFTGKASDVAGLVLFPLVLLSLTDCAVWSLGRDTLDVRFVLIPILLFTTFGFVGLQLTEFTAEAYDGFSSWIWRPAKTTQDPTDLYALPALLLAAFAAFQSDAQTDAGVEATS